MRKRYNVTGICIPEKHYMVDISQKVKQIVEEYIEPGYYLQLTEAGNTGKPQRCIS